MFPHGYAIGTTSYDLVRVKFAHYYTQDGYEDHVVSVDFGFANVSNASWFPTPEEAKDVVEEIKRRCEEIQFNNFNLFERVVLERKTLNPDDLKVYRIVLYEEEL